MRRKRQPNHRLVKIHRSYTVREIADLFSVHKNTVLNWVKGGLQPIDSGKPILIHGRELSNYLQARRGKSTRKCGPGELYCVGCRQPQKPAENIAEYSPISETTGNLVALCPRCGSLMHLLVSLNKIGKNFSDLDITFPEGMRHITKRAYPSVNCDLQRGVER